METHIKHSHIYKLRLCRFVGKDGKTRKTAQNARIENLWRCRCGEEIWVSHGVNPNWDKPLIKETEPCH